MTRNPPFNADADQGILGPFDPAEVEVPWFLPPGEAGDPDGAATPPLPQGEHASLVDAAGWRAAEAALAADLAELAFDAGRLAERLSA